ncbi:MAG: hypothetical protein FWD41_03575 [Actinomycetia bacterium]|nr:hypothetical protein [Actinomycetes bacterium]
MNEEHFIDKADDKIEQAQIHDVNEGVQRADATLGERLKALNRTLIITFFICAALLVLSDYIPATIGEFSMGWIKVTLNAVFSALLGALLIMLILDFHDIKSQISYLQDSIQTLLQIHEEDEEKNKQLIENCGPTESTK